jgi:hypothetical protein
MEEEGSFAIFLVLRVWGYSAGPEWAGGRGTWGALQSSVLHEALVAATLHPPVCRPMHEPLAWCPTWSQTMGRLQPTCVLPCSVLLTLLFSLVKYRDHFLGDWTLQTGTLTCLFSAELNCCICLTYACVHSPLSVLSNCALCLPTFYYEKCLFHSGVRVHIPKTEKID